MNAKEVAETQESLAIDWVAIEEAGFGPHAHVIKQEQSRSRGLKGLFWVNFDKLRKGQPARGEFSGPDKRRLRKIRAQVSRLSADEKLAILVDLDDAVSVLLDKKLISQEASIDAILAKLGSLSMRMTNWVPPEAGDPLYQTAKNSVN